MRVPLRKLSTDAMEDAEVTSPKPEENEDKSLVTWVKSFLPVKSVNDDSLRDAIEELIEEEDASPQSAVARHERRLITNILQLRDLPVAKVMVPRADIVATDIAS